VKYRKKPIVIEAVRFNGSSSAMAAINKWMETGVYTPPAVQTRDYMTVAICTLEGEMHARPGDWIIKGVKGEFYPCKPDVFAATYEPVEDNA
jgi:hypothetical protein